MSRYTKNHRSPKTKTEELVEVAAYIIAGALLTWVAVEVCLEVLKLMLSMPIKGEL